MAANIEELAQQMKRYITDPAAFVVNVLDAHPDKWQEEALQAIGTKPRISVRSGHGVGKTAFEAWCVSWFLFTRPFPKIPCTAPTQQQLFDILWPEISKWLKRSPLLDELFEWQKTKVVIFQSTLPVKGATSSLARRPNTISNFNPRAP